MIDGFHKNPVKQDISTHYARSLTALCFAFLLLMGACSSTEEQKDPEPKKENTTPATTTTTTEPTVKDRSANTGAGAAGALSESDVVAVWDCAYTDRPAAKFVLKFESAGKITRDPADLSGHTSGVYHFTEDPCGRKIYTESGMVHLRWGGSFLCHHLKKPEANKLALVGYTSTIPAGVIMLNYECVKRESK